MRWKDFAQPLVRAWNDIAGRQEGPMRDAEQCLAKANEMAEAAETCSDELMMVYYKLAADWNLLARYAEWQVRFLMSARPPIA